MNAASIARLDEVMPLLKTKVSTLIEMLAPEFEVRVTQGLRSWNQQNDLYEKGRTKPGVPCKHHSVTRPVGTCSEHPLGLRVTNAKGGESYHNFGVAVDVVPDMVGDNAPFIPDWDEKHPSWKRIIAVAESLGLTCGADWRTLPDFPHVQLVGRFPEGHPDDEVRQLFKDGGMQAVWEEVMKSYE